VKHEFLSKIIEITDRLQRCAQLGKVQYFHVALFVFLGGRNIVTTLVRKL